jgi:hypothetical protein
MDRIYSVGELEMAIMNWRRFGAAASLVLLASSTGAQATPQQGSLGATSQGSVLVTATVPARVQITGLTDLNFGTLDPTTAASSSENVCVWSNTSTKGYNVTATGDGGGTGNTFKLASGANKLDYTVEWAGTSGAVSGQALTTNVAKTGFTSNATAPNCSASTSATMFVKFSTAQMQAAVGSATAYTGTLTLVVAPE